MAEIVTMFLFLLVVGLVIACCDELFGRRKFRKVYPPISDEEFIQRLSPDVPPEIGLKVRELLVELTGVHESQIYPEAGLLELIGDVPPRFEETPPMRG